MPIERISIKDIAHAAGVTHPTVSRALNDSPLISRETEDRIRQLAEEIGYMPDAAARSLQRRRTHIIGLVVTSIGDPFFADLVKGVEEAPRGAGSSMFHNSSHCSRALPSRNATWAAWLCARSSTSWTTGLSTTG